MSLRESEGEGKVFEVLDFLSVWDGLRENSRRVI